MDLASWDDEPYDGIVFVKTTPCSKHQGIINADGTEESLPHNIYVEDNLMADIRRHIPMILSAAAEAIFIIMCQPMLHMRQCVVAMNKWHMLVVSHNCLILLGSVFNTW